MAQIKENKKLRRIIAIALTLVMILSLFTGIGKIFNKNSETVVEAASVLAADGTFIVPTATGELGTSTNPFVVLEIVPSEDMASFGYLVDGQEPIDLVSATTGEKGSEISEAIKKYLTADIKNGGKAVESRFYDEIPMEDFAKYIWVSHNTVNRYGTFTYTDGNDGAYVLEETKIEGKKSTETYQYVREDEVDPETDTIKTGIVRLMDVDGKLLEPPTGLTRDDCIERTDRNGVVWLKTTVWHPVSDRSGKYSSKRYLEGNANSGEYSMNYQYVGSGNGDTDYITDRYIIKSYSSSRYLCISGNNLIQRTSYRNSVASKNKEYHFKIVRDGEFYRFYTASSDFTKVLTASNTSAWAGNIVQATLYTGDKSAQQFRLQNGINNPNAQNISVNFRIDGNLAYMDVNGGSGDENVNIITWYSNGGNNQKFILESVSSDDGMFLPQTNGNYKYVKGTVSYPVYVGKSGGKNLGEYKEEAIGDKEKGSIDIGGGKRVIAITDGSTNKEGKKIYGSHDYDKYVLVQRVKKENDKDTYSYTLKVSEDGKGNYNWSPLTYSECYDNDGNPIVNVDEYPALSSTALSEMKAYRVVEGAKEVNAEKRFGVDASEGYVYPAEIKANVTDALYLAYEGEIKSQELFKKYAIGLAYNNQNYKDGNADISYTFDGWYTEPECMYKFNPSEVITKNTTVYARWRVTEPTEVDYTVSFKANAYETDENGITKIDSTTRKPIPDATVNGMPEDIIILGENQHGIRSGSTISAPKNVPIRNGYVFTGWYDDELCKTEHDFTKPVNENLVLYAGWSVLSSESYRIIFNGNESLTGLSGVTATIPATLENYRRNGRTSTFGSLSDHFEGQPTLTKADGSDSGYVFAGWYWYRSCEDDYRFEFDTNMPSDVVVTTVVEGEGDEAKTINTINLYAKWIKKDTTCYLTYNANVPSSDIALVTHLPENKSITYGTSADGIHDKDAVPVRKSAVEKKLEDYQVKVITVTPADLKVAKNLDLVDRANLIVINQQADDKLASYWAEYKNRALFPKSSYKTDKSVRNFYKAANDLDWNATVRILKKVAGIGTSGKTVKACPVVYDYSIYTGALNSTDCSKSVTFKSKFSGDQNYDGTSTKSSSNNVYKLYLMTQVLNPVTLYNAYIDKKSGTGAIENGSFTTLGIAERNDANAKQYWNKYTLIPFRAISQSEWNGNNKDAMALIGVNGEPEIANSLADSSKKKYADFNNRILIYNYSSSNMLSAFNTPMLESTGKDEMNKYMVGTSAAPTEYTLAETLYYLLNNKSETENFSKDLSILEIEAGDTYKNDSYWFWYISRYVPNFTGHCSVTKMNSSEFIGDIADLNSMYDVIFIGLNTDSSLASYYNNVMPKAVRVTETTSVVTETMYVDRTMEVNFEKKNVETRGNVTYSNLNGNYGNQRLRVNDAIKIVNGVPVLDADAIGQANIDNLELYIEANEMPEGYGSIACYDYSSDSFKYYDNIKIKSRKSGNTDYSNLSSGDKIWYWNYGDWYRYTISLDLYYTKRDNTEEIVTWEPHNAGETAYRGWTIRYNKKDLNKVDLTNNYIYAHVGKQITLNAKHFYGIYNNGWENNNTPTDDMDQFLYSGNDFTKVKYNALMEFASAGYPVIISRDAIDNTGNINTTLIDNSSYVYMFMNDLKTRYPNSFFVDNDTSKDEKFVKALQNKSFNLVISEKPLEYHDVTKSAYSGYSDSQIYINGSNPNNKNLKFKININSTSPGSTYSLYLYIDTNADGKYNEVEEVIDSLEIVNESTNKSESATKLKGNTNYVVTRRILDYAGAISWKLQVVDNSNRLVRDYVTGECAIKVDEKTKINVFQIAPNPNSSASFDTTVVFPTHEEIEKAKRTRGYDLDINSSDSRIDGFFSGCLDLAGRGNSAYKNNDNVVKNAGRFYYYTKILKEFDVTFYRMTVNEYEKMFSDDNDANHKKYFDDAGNCNYFSENGINMLVIGYCDCFTEISNIAALNYITDFISAGNTTLFTHDTTSFVNLEARSSNTLFDGSSKVYWGYNINQYFRTMLGMDRFDVMNNRGRGSLDGANDKPYAPGTNREQLVTATTSRTGTRILTQGLTNVSVGQDGGRLTTVTKSNDGQIVSYPYEIPDNFSVAETHNQYYQLDLEADDIVVWYCITASGNNYYKTNNDVRNNYYIYNKGNITYTGVGHSSGLSHDEQKLFVNTMIAAYRASSLPTEPVITNRDRSSEDKKDYLYVDYDATPESNQADPFGDEIDGPYTIEGTSDKYYTKEVYFTLKNYSIILNKQMTVHYYPVITKGDGTSVVLTDCPLDLKTYEYDENDNTRTETEVKHLIKRVTTTTNGDGSVTNRERILDDDGTVPAPTSKQKDTKMTGSKVESLKAYVVEIPISDVYYSLQKSKMYKDIKGSETDSLEKFALDSNNNFEIEIQVVMRYGRDPNLCEPLTGKRGAVFMRRGMFTLD